MNYKKDIERRDYYFFNDFFQFGDFIRCRD